MGDVTILQTARLYEADMLAHALRDAGVPCYQQSIAFGGIKQAMFPLYGHGPGQLYSVVVPEEAAEEAVSILETLPIMVEETPGFMSSNTKPEVRSVFSMLATFLAVSLLLLLLMGLLNMIGR